MLTRRESRDAPDSSGQPHTIVAKLHQDAVAAVDRAEVRGEDPALRFVGGAVVVSDVVEPADLVAIVVRKLSPVV